MDAFQPTAGTSAACWVPFSLCAPKAQDKAGGDGVGTAREVRHRIGLLDEDPLRSRREARELIAELAQADAEAVLDVPQPQEADDSAKGSVGSAPLDTIGVLIGAGSLIVTVVQAWLARVPNRTISVTRPDGTALKITGKQAQEDGALLDRFLSGESDDATDSED
ncbi:effector-associated constant component EACC1 [Streptomyces sp. H27-D2]|uniref:effector-associated constant component EACC1 n=1 Tax=Streptomyces sp. H27-D2 TaxID=3046304 RepID=UPI002DBE18EB|nr:hypothetical protein [Streptomyces sp. H27-D2]MEC4014971.1 hypothetical protein [Streptomyces sp. H27-D2]